MTKAAQALSPGLVWNRELSLIAVQRICGIDVFVPAPNDEICKIFEELDLDICRLGVAPANQRGDRRAMRIAIDEDLFSLPSCQMASGVLSHQ